MTKPEIARLIVSETNTTKEIVVQFFHSTFFKPQSQDYVKDFILFRTDLDNFLNESKDWSLDKTHLKGQTSEPLKIPKKVLKQMEDEYNETQAYIRDVIRQINED